jgi:predicted dehydrogenase
MSGAFEALGRTLRLGVIGGGPGGMIGPMHRNAARLDGRFAIVAGVPSSDPARAAAAGAAIALPEGRSYGTVSAMIDAERARADGIEAVAIMSPNDAHYPAAIAAIEAGLDVICDKPMTNTLADARDLAARVRASERVLCLTHAYAAYPMVRQARAMVAGGAIGGVRAVQVEYLHAGMATRVEDGPMTPKLRWKLDPARGGPSLVLGDIGTHAHHLACFVAGLPLARLAADLGALVPGRTIDDTAALLLRFAGGARGTLFASQAMAGSENNLNLRVWGESGLLEWAQTDPNYLHFARLDRPMQRLARGDADLLPAAQRLVRIPRGHPEGLLEAFANLYRDAAEAIAARITGAAPDPLALDFPTAEDGVRGVVFVEAAVRSGRDGGAWVACDSA